MIKKYIIFSIFFILVLLSSCGLDKGFSNNTGNKQNTSYYSQSKQADKYSSFVNAKWSSERTRITHFNKHVADISKGEKWNKVFGISEKQFKELLKTDNGREKLQNNYEEWIKKTIINGEVFCYKQDEAGRIGFYDSQRNIFATTDTKGKILFTCFRPDNGREYISNRDGYKKLSR